MSSEFGPLVDRLSNRPLCGFLALGEPRCEWLLNCLGRELSTELQVDDKYIVLGHLLCSKTVVPV